MDTVSYKEEIPDLQLMPQSILNVEVSDEHMDCASYTPSEIVHTTNAIVKSEMKIEPTHMTDTIAKSEMKTEPTHLTDTIVKCEMKTEPMHLTDTIVKSEMMTARSFHNSTSSSFW